MEVEHVFVGVVEDSQFNKEDFTQEMAKGLAWSQLETKRVELQEYEAAFENMDKDSFNAQYVETIIDNLKAEIKSMKKHFSN